MTEPVRHIVTGDTVGQVDATVVPRPFPGEVRMGGEQGFRGLAGGGAEGCWRPATQQPDSPPPTDSAPGTSGSTSPATAAARQARHAEARDLVGRNVAVLVDTPKGQAGRPSKSLTLEQASALLAAAESTRMHAYVALCLATGIRTEEARALRWEHVDFCAPDGDPPASARAAAWRSARAHGDTKTEKSRRTLGLPEMAVDALRAHKDRQAGDRLAAGAEWSDKDLVFCTRTAVPWGTRLTSGGSSGESVWPPGWESTGRHGSCVIPSCR